MRSIRLALAALCLTLGTAAGPAGAVDSDRVDGEKPIYVQFRDLFDRSGKPTEKAKSLDGKVIEMIGFSTAPPTRTSPFLVFVGAPTAHCPYCTAVSEMDHLPYVLIYAEHELRTYGRRDRLRVRGRLNAGHDHEQMYGLHYDLRLLDATVAQDARAENPARPVAVRARPAPMGGASAVPTADTVD